jgi:hypothetical protein
MLRRARSGVCRRRDGIVTDATLVGLITYASARGDDGTRGAKAGMTTDAQRYFNGFRFAARYAMGYGTPALLRLVQRDAANVDEVGDHECVAGEVDAALAIVQREEA